MPIVIRLKNWWHSSGPFDPRLVLDPLTKLAISRIGLRKLFLASVCFFGLSVLSNDSLAQQTTPGNPVAPSSASPSGQYVGSFIDPRTGKQYDRYLEQENVPVPRWEQQEVTERRTIPQWVTENIKTTEVQYVPYIEYQPQQRVLNRWNPMAQPQVTWDYVPITRYHTVNQVVDRPTTYQKYVEQDVKVLVPKLVQSTQSRSKYVDRERPAAVGQTAGTASPIQNAAELAMANRNNQYPRYTTRPMDGWYSGSQTPAALYPYSPYASVASVPYSPYFRNSFANNPTLLPGGPTPIIPMSPWSPSPMLQTQFVSNQTAVQPISSSYPSSYPPALMPTNSYAVTRPMFQWPSWTNNNGPLLRQDFFRQNQATSNVYGSQPYGGTAYGYPTVASQGGVSAALRPSTAPLLPQGPSANWGNFGGSQTYRDPIQAGLPPTVLR